MRKLPITITLPEALIRDLHSYIPRRQMSSFISKAIFEKLEHKKEKIAIAFRETAQNEELNEEFEIWDTCIGDGLDKTNDYHILGGFRPDQRHGNIKN